MKTVLMLATRPFSASETHEKDQVVTIADDLANYYIRNGIARFATYQQTNFDVIRNTDTGEIDTATSGGNDIGAPVTTTRDASGNVVGLSAGGDYVVVISTEAPVDADGRPDGTIYFEV